MRIKIGKYPTHLVCNIHTRYMIRKYNWLNWPEKQTKVEDCLEKLEDLIQAAYNATINKLVRQEQKMSIKIDQWDTYSMDSTLAHIVLPMLKQLKATKHGTPLVDDEDVPHLAKRGYKKSEGMQRDMFASHEHDELVWNQHIVRWDWIMDEMIWTFQEKCRDSWEERDKQKEHHERIENGFRLFGKYFDRLWD
jgi:hypothetical protein